jgi:hypothetical protein
MGVFQSYFFYGKTRIKPISEIYFHTLEKSKLNWGWIMNDDEFEKLIISVVVAVILGGVLLWIFAGCLGDFHQCGADFFSSKSSNG